MTLRSGGPDYAPLRVFRDDDLLDPGSDPLIALLGALSALRPRESDGCGAAAAALPGPRLVSAPYGEGPQAPRAWNRESSAYANQVRDHLQLDGVTMAVLGSGSAGGPAGLPVGAGRRRRGRPALLGDRHRPSAWLAGGLGQASLEEGPLPRLRPDPDHGRRSRASPSTPSFRSPPSCPPGDQRGRAKELLELH